MNCCFRPRQTSNINSKLIDTINIKPTKVCTNIYRTDFFLVMTVVMTVVMTFVAVVVVVAVAVVVAVVVVVTSSTVTAGFQD